MTKLIKKSVDVERILSCPHQSWVERLMSWGLSKPAIASIFVAIMGWFGKAFAQETEEQTAWNISIGKVTGQFTYSRKMVFVLGILVMIVCVILALFKKVSWFWLFNLLVWLSDVAIVGYFIDYIDADDRGNFLKLLVGISVCMLSFTICILPVLISLIQYKIKKINKKILKRRLYIWLVCGLIVGVVVGFLGLLSLLG